MTKPNSPTITDAIRLKRRDHSGADECIAYGIAARSRLFALLDSAPNSA